MKRWWYNLGILLYVALVKVAALFNTKARYWSRGRKNIFRRLREAIPAGERIFWLHAASLGEFEQGRPVLEELRKTHPEYKILLTFFSPSGYEVRSDYKGADYIFYLPADTPRNARRFMEVVRPEIAVFVKYEFWLNYLARLKVSGCHTFVISTIFRRDSVFFKWYGGIFREGLTAFERLFVQNESSRELLASIGIDRVSIAGDTRFDRVAEIASLARELPIIANFKAQGRVFVAGSTWSPDEEIILRAAGQFAELKFIIAPHEIDQHRIDAFIAASPRKAVRYTQCTEQTDLSDVQVLIVDTIGILSSVYNYARYAYIGGGFGVGIHNILEAATFGMPICFGPKYEKFKEARDLVELGSARSIESYEGFKAWLAQLEGDPKLYKAEAAQSAAYVSDNKGATGMILSAIFNK